MSVTSRERPILFSGPMVRAIIDGKKTQTRRIVKGGGPDFHERADFLRMRADAAAFGDALPDDPVPLEVRCPYGGPDDRLWVRETFGHTTGNGIRLVYRADGEEPKELLTDRRVTGMKWRPSIFMRRHESRLLLEVVAVRVERLQAITDTDIRAEGVDERSAAELLGKPVIAGAPIRDLWRLGWDSINGDRCAWVFDPWVWVVTFKRA